MTKFIKMLVDNGVKQELIVGLNELRIIIILVTLLIILLIKKNLLVFIKKFVTNCNNVEAFKFFSLPDLSRIWKFLMSIIIIFMSICLFA